MAPLHARTLGAAYAAALEQLIPIPVVPHWRRSRSKSIYFAAKGEPCFAKYFAVKLGADKAELSAVEMLIYGQELIPVHPGRPWAQD
jgi:hypothetical protein